MGAGVSSQAHCRCPHLWLFARLLHMRVRQVHHRYTTPIVARLLFCDLHGLVLSSMGRRLMQQQRPLQPGSTCEPCCCWPAVCSVWRLAGPHRHLAPTSACLPTTYSRVHVTGWPAAAGLHGMHTHPAKCPVRMAAGVCVCVCAMQESTGCGSTTAQPASICPSHPSSVGKARVCAPVARMRLSVTLTSY